MADQLVNEFTVNRPIDEAWGVITDVERIAPCLPGAQLQEIEGDIYRGLVKLKLGAMTFNIKGQATFMERDEATHRAVLKAEGRDTGGRGNAAAEIVATAESLSPTATSVSVTTDLQTSGKMAQFGRNVIGDVSKKLMDQFAGNLNAMLDDAATSPRVETEDRAADTSAPAANDGADPSGQPVEVAPRVRKIDGPDTEPVDLAATAGPAILKRLLPLLGVLVVLVVARATAALTRQLVATTDRDRVRALLGREPAGAFDVVVRDADGDPVVIRNAPLLDDGTPMPTRFWLVGPSLVRAVSRLEADGGVRAAEAAVDPAELARRPRPLRRRARRGAARRRPPPPDGGRRRHPRRREVPACPLRLVPGRR